MKPRYSFVVAAWVALWTAILCALPSGAISSPKMVGSAFDPATTSVALKSRSQTVARQSAARHTPPAPDIHIPDRRAIILTMAVAPVAIAPAFVLPFVATDLPGHSRGNARPRAPPHA
ncbi:hypothetical protein [Sphingomonas crocodyli]|uniref:hypothetical protein n=1 Tax=Sphingomonas crocodyli TaxID=1979270 RepID=UPI000FDC6F3F|nr:hypothetical protein [Sphingomonas crocodyli]